MKCPNCDYNQRRGREGMVCKKCRYDFVFDPQEDEMTDGKFLASVRRASSNDTYFFTANQLYAAACRRLRPAYAPLLLLVGIGFFAFILWKVERAPLIAKLAVGGFAVLILIACYFSLRPRLKRKAWDKHLAHWHQNRPPLKKLIQSPELKDPPPDCDEPDIYDYGVEQILICERDEVVDWLVLNNYHVNTKTAVISENGYPEYLIPKIRTLLAQTPPPSIYLLHDSPDSTPPMITRVRESRIFDLYEADLTVLGIDPELLPRIKSLRRVRRSIGSDRIAVDMIPLGTLSSMCSCAFAAQCAFGDFGPHTEGSTSLEFETTCSEDGDGE